MLIRQSRKMVTPVSHWVSIPLLHHKTLSLLQLRVGGIDINMYSTIRKMLAPTLDLIWRDMFSWLRATTRMVRVGPLLCLLWQWDENKNKHFPTRFQYLYEQDRAGANLQRWPLCLNFSSRSYNRFSPRILFVNSSLGNSCYIGQKKDGQTKQRTWNDWTKWEW